LDHLGNEEMFFLSPSVHVFEQSPFHLPEFFTVKGPTLSFQRLSKLDQGIFEIVPEPFHDMEVIVLKESVWPDFTDNLGEGRPEVEDNAVRLNIPVIELLEKPFSYATTIEPGDRLDIKDSDLNRISSDLFVSASSSGHVLIDRESSRELEVF
jgi:hypothetical protein